VPVELRVTGHAPDFPTVAPATPFALVDAPTLGLLTYLDDNGIGGRTEWWLRTDPGASTSVATALAASALPSSSIVDRARVLASLDSDPVGLGTLGALLLGSVAATAFAVIGFLVGASVATRERLGEFALLRALGLAPRQLWRWLAAENAFLLALGVLAGTAIGLLLGWLIVPATLLGASGEPVVPAPILEVPWPLIGLVYVAAAGLLVATILFVGRPLPGRSVAAILRATAE
jgi:predicted lysophospholipase L1 biosynthesis ABC-type transport system permease subunit